MFKSNGEHLATLGTHLNGPAGIAIDEDGFVCRVLSTGGEGGKLPPQNVNLPPQTFS